MSVFRAEKTHNFTVMDNRCLRNTALSLDALGVLAVLLSLPEDWNFSLKGFAATCKSGVSAIRTAIAELEEQKHLVCDRVRNEKGQLTSCEYTIYEDPALFPEHTVSKADSKLHSKNMTVFRSEKKRDYTVLLNHHLRNTALTNGAKGLFSIMLSRPNDWKYTIEGLAVMCTNGVASIRRIVGELEEHGYITRRRERNGKGQLKGMEYMIYEDPALFAQKDTLASSTEEAAVSVPTVQPESVPEQITFETAGVPGGQEHSAFSIDRIPVELDAHQEKHEQGKEYTTLGIDRIIATSANQPICGNRTQAENASFKAAHKNRISGKKAYATPICDFFSAKPICGFPTTGKPTTGNRTQLSNNILNTDSLSTGRLSIHQSRSALESQIELNCLCSGKRPDERERIKELVTIMHDAICSAKTHLRVAGEYVSAEAVRSCLSSLDSSHIEYVLECMGNTTGKIKNIKAYLLTALYNSPATIGHYYQADVNHDLRGCRHN